MEIGPLTALLIVDPQNDFMPRGSLAVPEGNEIFSTVNTLTRQVPLAMASQDWHPVNHISFKEQGGPWPPHCVQGTAGAEFYPELDQSRVALIVRKGYLPEREQYSCFDQTGLAQMLKGREMRDLLVTGVATDYCVLWSALGALEGGLKVFVVKEGVRGVEVNPGDVEQAFDKMAGAGAEIISSREIKSAM